MKAGLHPEYKEATIKCACGATVQTHSVKGDLNVEICSKCHPFYTGKQKFVDAGGRLDKFKSVLQQLTTSNLCIIKERSDLSVRSFCLLKGFYYEGF